MHPSVLTRSNRVYGGRLCDSKEHSHAAGHECDDIELKHVQLADRVGNWDRAQENRPAEVRTDE